MDRRVAKVQQDRRGHTANVGNGATGANRVHRAKSASGNQGQKEIKVPKVRKVTRARKVRRVTQARKVRKATPDHFGLMSSSSRPVEPRRFFRLSRLRSMQRFRAANARSPTRHSCWCFLATTRATSH